MKLQMRFIAEFLFGIVTLIAAFGVLALNIELGETGFYVAGIIMLFSGIIMAGTAPGAWDVIFGLLLLGFYLFARGAGYLTHQYLRYALAIFLFVLAAVHFYYMSQRYNHQADE